MCHHNTFLIYGSIADPNQKKWEIITHASIVTSLVVAVLFGIAGYATFKAYSQGNVVKKIAEYNGNIRYRKIFGRHVVPNIPTIPIVSFVF